MKKQSEKKARQSCCPLTKSPRLRSVAEAQTAAIKDHFPSGMARPALRALLSAGITHLDQVPQYTEDELAALHGMGPKALAILRAALKAKGKDFRQG